MHRITALATILVLTSAVQAQTAGKDMSMDGMDHMNMDHAAHESATVKAQRQAQVSKRGEDVRPFSLAATRHIFTKDAEGGVQQVVVRDNSAASQIPLIRRHLRAIRTQFLQGDFYAPSHIHGAQMPGLAEIEGAKPGRLSIEYQDIEGGAQLAYRATDPRLVAAIHEWLDAQVSDHGKDAQEGHRHSMPK